jgi:hypothetical protein
MKKTIVLTHHKSLVYQRSGFNYHTKNLINIHPIYNLNKVYGLDDEDLPDDISFEVLDDNHFANPVKLTYDPSLYFITMCEEEFCPYNPFILFQEFYYVDDIIGVSYIIKQTMEAKFKKMEYHKELDEKKVTYKTYQLFIPISEHKFRINFRYETLEEELENE